VSIYLIISPADDTLSGVERAGAAVGQPFPRQGPSFPPGWLIAAKDAATEAFRHAVLPRGDPADSLFNILP